MIKLIAHSTKEERKQIIEEMFQCQNGNCEQCGICRIFKYASPQEVYQDYIDGKKEFSQITQEMNRRQ